MAAPIPLPPPLPDARKEKGPFLPLALPPAGEAGPVEDVPSAALPDSGGAGDILAKSAVDSPEDDLSGPGNALEEAALPPEPGATEVGVGRIRLIPPPGVIEMIPIALLLPLSGPNAALGTALLQAAELALFDVAEADFTLLPFDTGGTPEGARRAVDQALEEGVRLILGPMFATSVAAIAPKARAAGVPVISFSSDRAVAGDGVFVLGFLPRDEVERVVAFARSRGILRFAALVPETAYGSRVVEALEQAVARHGGTVVRVETYSPGAGDVSGIVKRLANYVPRRAALEEQREALMARGDEVSRQALRRLERLETLGDVPFEAVLLPVGGDQLRAIAPLLPFYDIDPLKVRLIGTSQWDDSSLGTEPTLIGGWFAASPPEKRTAFTERYKKMFGTPPVRLATLAYDATALAAVLARSDAGPDFSLSALTARNGFDGLDGIFRLKANGVAERGLAVLEMQRNRVRVLSRAPDVFGDLTN